MTPAEGPSGGSVRLYTVIGGMVGLLAGVYLQSTLPHASPRSTLGWLVAFGLLGALIAWLLLVIQHPRVDRPTAPEPLDEASVKPLFKLQSGVFTEQQLQTMRVRSVTMPMSPPDASIPLQVARYDKIARVVAPGLVPLLTAEEAAAAARREAQAHAPAVVGDDTVEFSLVSYHSAGPLGPDGSCAWGWTFTFVSGRHGLACRVIATSHELALSYDTVTTYSVPRQAEWVDAGDVLKWIEAELPGWAEVPLRLRVHLPDDYLVYAESPLRIVDVDVVRERVANADFLGRAGAEPRSPGEEFTLAEVRAWFRGELGDGSALATAAGADPGFAEELRTLAPGALARVGAALQAADGVGVTESLEVAIDGAPDIAAQTELLRVLAYLPNDLAIAALHRLSEDPVRRELAAAAAELLRARRSDAIDVPNHPLERLTFLDVRRAMGRGADEVVALRSTFDPERELLAPLEELGFTLTRRRLLSGDSRTLAGAQLRSHDHGTDLLLTSTPLPLPCHILHVIGHRADSVSEAIRRLAISYPRVEIVADAHSCATPRVHRAALYIAALRLAVDGLTESLVVAYSRSKHDASFRQAIYEALAVQEEPQAADALDSIAATAPEEAAAIAAARARVAQV